MVLTRGNVATALPLAAPCRRPLMPATSTRVRHFSVHSSWLAAVSSSPSVARAGVDPNVRPIGIIDPERERRGPQRRLPSFAVQDRPPLAPGADKNPIRNNSRRVHRAAASQRVKRSEKQEKMYELATQQLEATLARDDSVQPGPLEQQLSDPTRASKTDYLPVAFAGSTGESMRHDQRHLHHLRIGTAGARAEQMRQEARARREEEREAAAPGQVDAYRDVDLDHQYAVDSLLDLCHATRDLPLQASLVPTPIYRPNLPEEEWHTRESLAPSRPPPPEDALHADWRTQQFTSPASEYGQPGLVGFLYWLIQAVAKCTRPVWSAYPPNYVKDGALTASANDAAAQHVTDAPSADDDADANVVRTRGPPASSTFGSRARRLARREQPRPPPSTVLSPKVSPSSSHSSWFTWGNPLTTDVVRTPLDGLEIEEPPPSASSRRRARRANERASERRPAAAASEPAE